MCDENSEEVACTINSIASTAAVCMHDFTHLKEDQPSTICGWVIPRCELIAIRARQRM